MNHAWTGWIWQADRWQRAATGATLATAATALSHAADAGGVADADVILTASGTAPVGPPLGRVYPGKRGFHAG